ncbi:MAG: FlgO family outer membrane protein [Nitrospinota bacterium]
MESHRGPNKVEMSPDNLNKHIDSVAKQLFDNLQGFSHETSPVVVTTIVELDSLGGTSQFGRYVSERLVYVLHNMGFQVFEIRQSKMIKVLKRKGEFHLTREASELLNRFRSDAVIVGTYLLVDEELSMQVRMLDRDSSRIISVASAEFKLGDDPFLRRIIIREDSHIDINTSLVPLEKL